MSSVRVGYMYPDGSVWNAQAWADDTSPVAMAIARVTAVEALMDLIDDDDIDTDVLFPPESIDGES